MMKFKNKILAILVIGILIISATGVSAVSNLTDENKTVNEATVVANTSSEGTDCANMTFETEGNDYESYCVEYGEHSPEIGTVYTVEENLTSNGKITDEQAQKIKIFSIEYKDVDLTHNTINPNTGKPTGEIDDATSRQLIIWNILGQGKEGWYNDNHVNKTIIDHINELYDDGLRYDDNGVTPLNDTHQLDYIFKYFSSIESALQDFIGWLFVESDIPPETDNQTIDNQTDDNDTDDNQTDDKPVGDTNDTRINKTNTNPIMDNDSSVDDTRINTTNTNPIMDNNISVDDNSSNNTIPIQLLKTGYDTGVFLIACILLIIGLVCLRRYYS